MKTTKSRNALIILFLAMIFLPYLLWEVLGHPFDVPLHENRQLAEKPVLSAENIETLPKAYEAYINDHLPFRSAMLRTYSETAYRLFHTSMTYQVIFGKDGWLFHRDRNDADAVTVYRGLNMPDDAQVLEIREGLVAARDLLAEKGIAFVILLPPMKERMYPEYMPELYGAPSEDYALRRIYEDLKAHTDLCVIYPYEVLTEAKAALPADTLLYYKTDSHWNELGAYIAAVPLLKELGITLPSYDDPAVRIEAYPSEMEDMTHLVTLENIIDPGTAYRVSGYERHHLTCTGGDFDAELFFTAKGADPRKLMFFHDSFGEQLQDVICAQFDEAVMVHHKVYTPEMIDRYKPDVFILEISERGVAGGLSGFTVGQ